MGRILPQRTSRKLPVGQWSKRNKPLAGRQTPRLPHERPTDPERESAIASDRLIGIDTIGLDDELLFAGEVGKWHDVLSTYLNRVRFDWASNWGGGPPWPPGGGEQRKGYLTVEFLDLAIVEYPGETFQTFSDLINSASKGSYMWYASSGLQHKTGNKIRDGQRTVTQDMKDKRDLPGRNPRGKGRMTY